jgi:hypothetical protein
MSSDSCALFRTASFGVSGQRSYVVLTSSIGHCSPMGLKCTISQECTWREDKEGTKREMREEVNGAS